VDDEIDKSGMKGREVRADDAVLEGDGGAVNLMKGILLPSASIIYSIIKQW
jgi:hypothetical protein